MANKMKYRVLRVESRNNSYVETIWVGDYKTYDKANCIVHDDVSYFREHHDNDERIDWDIVDVYDDIGNCNRFEWFIEEIT